MQKVFFRSTVLAALIAGPAVAADMPVKARPLSPPQVDAWSGFYAGLNAGYGWGDGSSTNSAVDPASALLFAPGLFGPTDFNTRFRQRGTVAGGQAGYNWQLPNRLIFGVEADLQWADLKGSGFHQAFLLPAAFGTVAPWNTTADHKLEWFGTLRARLGFLATPNLLLYGTGGLAYGGSRSAGSIVFAPLPGGGALVASAVPGFGFACQAAPGAPSTCYAGSGSQSTIGWSAGVGGEYRFANNWSAKLEYLHIDLGSNSVRLVSPPPSTPGVATIFNFNHQGCDVVRVGFNYKFGGPVSPVVARY